jgi:hypothetical protein
MIRVGGNLFFVLDASQSRRESRMSFCSAARSLSFFSSVSVYLGTVMRGAACSIYAAARVTAKGI